MMNVGNESTKVLILEYDKILRDLISMTLNRYHFVPVICQEPQFVRDMIQENSPNILLMDTHLPTQSGIELVRQLKSEGALEGRFVIVLSSLGFPSVVREAIDAGANDFMVKPINFEILMDRLEKRTRVG